MSQALIGSAIAAYCAGVVIWLMAWKSQLQGKLDQIAKIAKDTYDLSNSRMAKQLRLNLVLTARVAEMTGKADDKEQAEISKVEYQDHEQKQGVVDRKGDDESHHARQETQRREQKELVKATKRPRAKTVKKRA